MNAHQDGPERGLLDAALFAEEPTAEPDLTAVAVETLSPDEPPTPAPSMHEGGVNYALTTLAPGLYEVTEPGESFRVEPSTHQEAEDPPSPVQVQFPTFDLNDADSDLEPLPAYEWPEADEPEASVDGETVCADEPTVEIHEEDVDHAEPVEVVSYEEADEVVEVAPAERRPLILAVNAGLTLGPAGTVVLTADELRLVGDDPFLLDILLLSAPEQGVLLRDGFALTGGDVFTQEDIDHGRLVYRHEGDIGEDGFVFATPEEEVPATIFAIRVEPARLAPELLAPGRLTSCSEGTRVAELLQDTVRSHEPEVPPGLALTGATGRGQWEYSLDGGASWQPIGDVEPARAFLLGPTDTVRFVPRQGWAGRAQFAYRAWDRSAGEAGSRVDLSGDQSCGGATAFSDSATSVTATVSAPAAHVAVPDPWCEASAVADLFGDAAAVVRLDGVGVWQFSLDDGKSWQDFGDVFHGRARLLRGQDRVRFLAGSGASGKVMISTRPWDGSGWGAGAVISLAGHRTVGDGTAFGEVSRTRSWRMGV